MFLSTFGTTKKMLRLKILPSRISAGICSGKQTLPNRRRSISFAVQSRTIVRNLGYTFVKTEGDLPKRGQNTHTTKQSASSFIVTSIRYRGPCSPHFYGDFLLSYKSMREVAAVQSALIYQWFSTFFLPGSRRERERQRTGDTRETQRNRVTEYHGIACARRGA